jgi:hypothetical protein
MSLFFQDLSIDKQEAIITYLKANPGELEPDNGESLNDEHIDETIDDFINRHNNSEWIKEITEKV